MRVVFVFLYEVFISLLVLLALALVFWISDFAWAETPEPRVETVSNQTPPDHFTAFELADHDGDAELLNRFLWYHFHHRMGNIITLFNKEYLAVADLWLDNALDRASQRPIQSLFREFMVEAYQDDEGYVSCHQHISHAHDLGWPFPLWVQSHLHPDRVRELTMGWHFQSGFPPHWTGHYLEAWNRPEFYGDTAVASFSLDNLESLGIIDDCWHLRATGANPTLTTQADIHISAFNAPFVQLRWRRNGETRSETPPYLEWMREGDTDFSGKRRVYFYPERTPLSDGFLHSHIRLYRHPEWKDIITRLRLNLAPGEEDVSLEIDSLFTAYDTRHTINNPILILGSSLYFNWTRDLGFLRDNINRMRLALLYQQTVMGGREHGFIRVPFIGHNGGPGFVLDESGDREMRPGHGIGNNYWDLLPFGGDDFFATAQYYASTLAMADLEEAILAHPEWNVAVGALAQRPEALRAHAAQVKHLASEMFWNAETGRFIPCITHEGKTYDFGLTFLNLEAIWYDIATEEQAQHILDWLQGRRIVEGDTSTGEDIYVWRFGPRATTRRNVEWYNFVWSDPASIPWGGQVQDGGGVLGFSFYDLWARLHHENPDNAWTRLLEILAWQQEVDEAGGYRAYYQETDRGTTLQGGGTAGGVGIDFEFFESSMVPAIIPLGFMGISAAPAGLRIAPKLPEACPSMTVKRLRYGGTPLNVTVASNSIEIETLEPPVLALPIALGTDWTSSDAERRDDVFLLETQGVFHFSRQ